MESYGFNQNKASGQMDNLYKTKNTPTNAGMFFVLLFVQCE